MPTITIKFKLSKKKTTELTKIARAWNRSLDDYLLLELLKPMDEKFKPFKRLISIE